MLTEDELLALMKRVDPETKRVPPGVRAIANAIQDAERERGLIALREWAVERWRAEVEHRPLVNKHRRSLDDCWRQVMRYAGIDPDEAVGPAHDALLAALSADQRSGMLAGDALAGGL